MNRLRAHYVTQQEQKPQRRLQREIVAAYRDDIISLISDDGATLPEVADAVRAQGEPVLDPGFKAAILAAIGSVKDIKAGRVMPSTPRSVAHLSSSEQPQRVATAMEATTSGDDDVDFRARRPRS